MSKQLINKKLKKELIKSRRNVKRKLELLKSGQIEKDYELLKTYTPLTSKLDEINDNLKNISQIKAEKPNEYIIKPELASQDNDSDNYYDNEEEDVPIEEKYNPNVIQDYLNDFNPLLRPYVEEVILKSNDIDKVYGVKYIESQDGEYFTMGNKIIDFIGTDIKIGDDTFPGTNGLYELLFKKYPKNVFNAADKLNYSKILEITNAARRNYNPVQQLKGNNSAKYIKIIKALLKKPDRQRSFSLSPMSATSTAKLLRKPIGEGMLLKDAFADKPFEYVHWNDPNELVDRLKLLISSQIAGNNNHNNEIISIIEELKESNIIE